MRISDDVANVLANSRVEDNLLFLPDVQLDRKLYVAVNKVLQAIHGTWNRGKKAHVFDESPADAVEQIVQTGEYVDQKKEYQFFETPVTLAERLVEMADIQEGETVLEPSAGKARIANVIGKPDCVELNEECRQYLQDNGFNLVGADFLEFEGEYDVIIANPPFCKQQDIDHVNHMMDLARRRVVSIMSASVMWRDNKKTVAFRERVEALGGTFESLDEGTFAESGTNVRACIVCVNV